MNTITETAIRQHLADNPETNRAALTDPECAATVNRLLLMLTHVDSALTAEGLSPEVRQRVAGRVASDCLGTDEANARMVERDRAMRDIKVTGAAYAALKF
ncbi:hypothetical protein [Streptomyces inusitatus]|nr:hypothetical protein [Streptomyces inusitatus]